MLCFICLFTDQTKYCSSFPDSCPATVQTATRHVSFNCSQPELLSASVLAYSEAKVNNKSALNIVFIIIINNFITNLYLKHFIRDYILYVSQLRILNNFIVTQNSMRNKYIHISTEHLLYCPHYPFIL
jgi:hypothetical protein